MNIPEENQGREQPRPPVLYRDEWRLLLALLLISAVAIVALQLLGQN